MDKHDNKNNALCHMREILDLQSALVVAKARANGAASNDTTALDDTIEREMADLLLLLQSIVPEEVVSERRKKFPVGVLD